jgi:ATP-dependent DNA helicase RecG
LQSGWQQVEDILDFCHTPQAIQDIMVVINWSNRTKFRDKYINMFLDLGLIQMTIPDKPKSSKQKYKTSRKGTSFLTLIKKNNLE